ncbi:hypothetical protein P154DRAFT_572878 [Amniculicola lignicola CBS 123094]|uniref:Uncharacterized protein n=1 Tax=Amniculicola lignicola CBS 123094 TaxID=1392246 RepID=A0A6A5WP38_9PLEO|nr:hypothetical protein P154DRAFT_572878 [Amniculicola lignicola CBS 123094]
MSWQCSEESQSLPDEIGARVGESVAACCVVRAARDAGGASETGGRVGASLDAAILTPPSQVRMANGGPVSIWAATRSLSPSLAVSKAVFQEQRGGRNAVVVASGASAMLQLTHAAALGGMHRWLRRRHVHQWPAIPEPSGDTASRATTRPAEAWPRDWQTFGSNAGRTVGFTVRGLANEAGVAGVRWSRLQQATEIYIYRVS